MESRLWKLEVGFLVHRRHLKPNRSRMTLGAR